jgi:exopolysaccharide/PEP-CTERM locus tyrosine autokinase
MSSIEKALEKLNKQSGEDNVIPEPLRASVRKSESSARSQDVDTGQADTESTKEHRHIDLSSLEAKGYLIPGLERTKSAEEYRLLKRPLLMNAFGEGAAPVDSGNLIMVTSAMPGEGKTYTSLNLAMSMAMELDSTVLLIDSDVLKPSLSSILGLKDEPGLVDILTDPSLDIGDVIINTDIPRLRVLPAGSRHVNTTELLASEQMKRVITELSARYSDRICLFDAPPLLATSEAGVLAHLMGQILMVVESYV